MKKTKEKGMSIIEVIGSFAIIAVMSALIMSFYGKVSHKTNYKKTEFLLEEIREKIKSLYIGGNYSGISLTELNENLEESEMVLPKHPLDGAVEICGNSSGYNIILKGLSIEDSTKLETIGEGEIIIKDDETVFMGYKENIKTSKEDKNNYCNN